jgi:ABC-type Mn2+/Zn2+ transport system ATPase subunit
VRPESGASPQLDLHASIGPDLSAWTEQDSGARARSSLPTQAGSNSSMNSSMGSPIAIRLQGVTAGYDHQPVLHSVDFEVSRGESVSILGENGAGKTTLLRLILGLIKPWSGTIEIEGRPILSEADRRWIRQRVGYVPQGTMPGKLPISVHDAVLLGRWGKAFSFLRRPTRQDRDAATQALKLVGMDRLAARDCRELSGGQVQRLNIARALVRTPSVLLLDEPSTYLDPKSAESLVELLYEIRKHLTLSIIVVSHDEMMARQFADRTYRVSDSAITPEWGGSVCL